MKVIANYTEVYRIDEDGNATFYCFFFNTDSIQTQLAWLLVLLKRESFFPHRDIFGNVTEPIKEAEQHVVLTGMDPMPRAFFEYNGLVYFGHVREYREIEYKKWNN